MISHHVYYQLAVVGLLWLCAILYYIWSSRGAAFPQPLAAPVPPQCKRKRSNEPTPFEGLTQRPHCAACAHDATHAQVPPPRCPEPMPPTHRRPCAIDTSRHFCPHAGCDYRGWLGLGNLRANGHPGGGPWRQLWLLHAFGDVIRCSRAGVYLEVRLALSHVWRLQPSFHSYYLIPPRFISTRGSWTPLRP